MSWKHSAMAVAAALALGAPAPARADNSSTALKIIGVVLSFIPGAQGWGAAFLFAGNVAGNAEQRRKLRKAEAARRQKAIDSLQARNVTLLTAEPPMRGGYGRSLGGGDVVAMFSTDKVVTDDFGNSQTRPDALKHLVIHYQSRQIQAINEVFIDNVPVGALDADGYPTAGEFYSAPEATRTIVIPSGTSFTLAADARPATAIVGVPFYTTGSGSDTLNQNTSATIAGDGLSISVPSTGADVTVTYTYGRLSRPVRIRKFLGSPTQTVDTYLNGLVPDKWTADHRLRGLAGIVVTLDLEDQRFQGGLVNITAEGDWALVYDPRLDSTQPGGSGTHRYTDPTTWAWSANPALCTADWLCSELGYKCNPATDIDWAYVIAAANACDATGTFDEGAGPFTAARYTCHGVFSADESKEKVLEDLTESMAGTAIPAAQWQVMAGAWTTPVATLNDDDLNGSIEVVQADTATDSLINSARGRYIPAGKSQPAEANPPYTNPVFVTADQGVKLWDDFQFPYTSSNARVRDLLRIKVEQRRSGLVINYPAKLKHWGLRVGERVYVNHAPFVWVNKPFRITDRRHTQQAPVLFTLQEDDPTIWDQADAATADPTPNTGLPSPHNVVALASLAATSSESTMLRTADGTWVPGIDITWAAITDRSSIPDGRVEIFWNRNTEGRWRTLAPVPADTTAARISGGVLREGDRVLIKARVRNRFGRVGPDSFVFVAVVGKSSAPATPTSLAATAQPGGVLVSVAASTAPDFKETEFRVGASWAAGTVLYIGRAASFLWTWPTAGTYTVRAKHRDTSGNESAEATTSITFTADQIAITRTPTEVTSGYTGATAITSTYGYSQILGLFGLHAFTLVAPADVTITTSAVVGTTNSTGSTKNLKTELQLRADNDVVVSTQLVNRQLVNGETFERSALITGTLSLGAGTHIAGFVYNNFVGAGFIGMTDPAAATTRVEIRYK
jgi:hypothetical protein